MKPIIILPTGSMSQEDIEQLRKNDLCVVVAKEPNLVKFVDPIPAVSQRTKIEDAAIRLSRKVLNPGYWQTSDTCKILTQTFFEILSEGTPLSAAPTQEEKEKAIFDNAKADELKRLACEEAKAERAAAKAAKQTKPTIPTKPA